MSWFIAGIAIGFIIGIISAAVFAYYVLLPFLTKKMAKEFPEVAEVLRPMAHREPAVFAPQMSDQEALEFAKGNDLQSKLKKMVEPSAEELEKEYGQQ